MSDNGLPRSWMSDDEIAAFPVDPEPNPSGDRRQRLRDALIRAGQYGSNQTAGRFHPGACAALEVTQRCNLDCTLCYLSEAAELAFDPPLDVLIPRIDMLARHYGPGANIQITGGDPTLRSKEDLSILIRRIRSHEMRSCLMTNGLKATRALLSHLAAAGLDDVAFHVDLTQERKGFTSEASLNEIRDEYIQRAGGLGLRILFNTTIFGGNFNELPALARYFKGQARNVTLASFQIQADTGRGVLRGKSEAITLKTVEDAITAGFGADIGFGAAAVGHQDCNSYANVLVAGDRAASTLPDRRFFEKAVHAFEAADNGEAAFTPLLRTAAIVAVRRPRLAMSAIARGFGRYVQLRRAGPISRISILIHNFMDARHLSRDRCDACVFKVATADGPLSMCVHNARRDHHLFQPAKTSNGWWSASTGAYSQRPALSAPDPQEAPLKRLKGRERARRLKNHPNNGEQPAMRRGSPARSGLPPGPSTR